METVNSSGKHKRVHRAEREASMMNWLCLETSLGKSPFTASRYRRPLARSCIMDGCRSSEKNFYLSPKCERGWSERHANHGKTNASIFLCYRISS